MLICVKIIPDFQEEVGTGGGGAVMGTSNRAMQAAEMVYFNDQADRGYREQTEMVYGISVDR